MAEAMFEVVLPDYFKKFQPNFKFVITEKVPNLSAFKNYAFGSHFKSEYCPFSVENEKKISLPYIDSSRFRGTIKPNFSFQIMFQCSLYFHLLQILSFSC